MKIQWKSGWVGWDASLQAGISPHQNDGKGAWGWRVYAIIAEEPERRRIVPMRFARPADAAAAAAHLRASGVTTVSQVHEMGADAFYRLMCESLAW